MIETLLEIPLPDVGIEDLKPMDQARRVQLAAAAGEGVAVNSRLELYPKGMEARRALSLSRSALFGAKVLEPQQVEERVRSRYPEAEPLPPRPELDRLFEELGFAFEWDPKACDGKGAYRSKHAISGSLGSTIGSYTRYQTIDTRKGPREIDEQVAEAERLEAKLEWAREQGSYLALAVDPRLMNQAATELERFKVTRLSANQLFLDAMKEQAASLKVNWDLVLSADAAKPGSPDWTKLKQLVQRAIPSVLERLRRPEETILLTDLGLFARYGQMHEIDSLRNDAGTPDGPFGLWLLVPSHGASLAPSLCGEAVPITNPAQFETLNVEWVRNMHRGEAA